MPDIASMMQNPELMRMAGQLAANGGLAQLMQDPTIASMVRTMAYHIFRWIQADSPFKAERARSGNMPSSDELRSLYVSLGDVLSITRLTDQRFHAVANNLEVSLALKTP